MSAVPELIGVNPTAGGPAIAYAEAGPPHGPVVVLVPGGSGAVATSAMTPMWQLLSDTYRCILVETRGAPGATIEPRGFTTADIARDIVDLLDVLGVEEASVIGASLGSLIGQEMAAELGNRLRAAVFGFSGAGGDGFFSEVCFHLAELARERPQAFLVASALWGGGPQRWDRYRTDQADPVLRELGPLEGTARRFEAGGRHDARDLLGAISARVLVVSAEHDLLLRPELGRQLADAVPQGTFELMAGASHMAINDDPAAFANRCRRFLDGA